MISGMAVPTLLWFAAALDHRRLGLGGERRKRGSARCANPNGGDAIWGMHPAHLPERTHEVLTQHPIEGIVSGWQ
jgi:hypothetical protein